MLVLRGEQPLARGIEFTGRIPAAGEVDRIGNLALLRRWESVGTSFP
ncbi:hypothetical protein CyaNS01_02872 [Cyanobium sp. NS01]|nr:hypothetical protein CyaNS01_02872 [Cyanobium sp. NS01]